MFQTTTKIFLMVSAFDYKYYLPKFTVWADFLNLEVIHLVFIISVMFNCDCKHSFYAVTEIHFVSHKSNI